MGSGGHWEHTGIARARKLFAVERWEGVVHKVKHSGSGDTFGSVGLVGAGGRCAQGARRLRDRLFAVGTCCGVAHTVESRGG